MAGNMTRRVQDQVAIITGSGAGIGRATAELFAEEGAKVVVVDVDVEGGEACVAGIKKNGGEAVFMKVDISNEDECRLLAENTVAKYGRIDCLVNNAAVFVLKNHLNGTKEDWMKSFSVNVFGTALVSKYVSQKMIEQRSGSIVNIGSMSAHIAQVDLTCYSATKAAIVGMTRNMAMDLAPYNIRVNSLSPGSVFTVAAERHAKILGISIDQFKKEQGELNFLKRMADPREIAAPILFLSSKEASFITGADLLADGGYTAM